MNISKIFSFAAVFFSALGAAIGAADGRAAVMIPAAPAVNADSYLLLDHHSGRRLIERDIDVRVEPASLTKIMTVYVVAAELEKGAVSLEDRVTVSKKAWRMEGSRMFIEAGKMVSVDDLLQGVVVQSGNDASVALAEYIGGDEQVFTSMMNLHAEALGMSNTRFANSTGLPDPNHYTTAEDMATLAQALIREFPEIYALHAAKKFTFNNITQNNRNDLLWKDDSVDGIKTGHTRAAGYCLVASAIRADMRLISIVMGADSDSARALASQSMLNYGFRFYETKHLFAPGEKVADGRVWKGAASTFPLGAKWGLAVTIPRGSFDQLQTEVRTRPRIIAPVSEGLVYGAFHGAVAGEPVAETPLIALEAVETGGSLRRMFDAVMLWFE